MKILTGLLKGRTLAFAPKVGLRPTADKVRKAIYDTLQDFVEGKSVLDLFSGTGALGIEAFSAGASEVTFVDSDKAQCDVIEKNLRALDLLVPAHILPLEADQALELLERHQSYFDLVLMDAPYNLGLTQNTLELLCSKKILSDGSFVVAECDWREKIPSELKGKFYRLKQIKLKEYGGSKLIYFKVFNV